MLIENNSVPFMQPSFNPYWYGGGEIVDGNATWPLQGIKSRTLVVLLYTEIQTYILFL